MNICPHVQFTPGGLVYYCQSGMALHYNPLGGIMFNNETMDVLMRQGNTQHRTP